MHSAQTCHALTCIHTLNYTRNANNSMFLFSGYFFPLLSLLVQFLCFAMVEKRIPKRTKRNFQWYLWQKKKSTNAKKKLKKCKEKCGLDFKAIICDQAILDHYSFVAFFWSLNLEGQKKPHFHFAFMNQCLSRQNYVIVYLRKY